MDKPIEPARIFKPWLPYSLWDKCVEIQFSELLEDGVQKYMRDTTLDTKKIRRDIMALAREHGIADQIPEHWNEDGSLKSVPAEDVPKEDSVKWKLAWISSGRWKWISLAWSKALCQTRISGAGVR